MCGGKAAFSLMDTAAPTAMPQRFLSLPAKNLKNACGIELEHFLGYTVLELIFHLPSAGVMVDMTLRH